jgi:hypothetical protein
MEYAILAAALVIPIVMYLFSLITWQDSTSGLIRRDVDASDSRYISDDEFLAACSPGVRREDALKVRQIIAEQLCFPEQAIHPSHRLVEDLGAD